MRLTLLLFTCVFLYGCSSESTTQPSPNPYVMPKEFAIAPTAERGPEGEIYISGTTNFPDGMKMWVQLGPKKAQEDAIVRRGHFRSGPLYLKVATPVTGRQRLEFIAYFNGAWQNNTVLSLLGEEGKNLHGKLFKQTDPDVIDSPKILDATFNVTLPPLAPETAAISIVKHAILTVPDFGRSATDIEENLALFTKPGTGVKPGKGWSAAPAGPSLFNVSYDFINGDEGEQQAIWSVNVATKQVKYVNHNAKLFSWTPKD